MAPDHRSQLHGEFGEDSEGSFGLYIVGRIEFGELCKVIRKSHCMCELRVLSSVDASRESTIMTEWKPQVWLISVPTCRAVALEENLFHRK